MRDINAESQSKNARSKGLVLSSLKAVFIAFLIGLIIFSIMYFYYTGDIAKILAKIKELPLFK